ncbi:type II toxin-antitoxin system PemK/MazF family toxin [Euzebya tangerina]|uniref:type II toxin-antitoxin system PemK/MazF family toxin n=1 Tax=Euzebya tangerina TaxID=591198 RepID=UPI0013C34FAA|nr:type II toxin-antitoxin system PemK/MazF family toxin [Euzebya tangerina]
MSTPQQGEIWWAEAEDKRRPVLIVTRSDAVPHLGWLVAAPVTRTVRGIPTELPLDEDHGLPEPCVASFDNLQPIRRAFLTDRVGALGLEATGAICQRLSAMADC